MKRLIQALPLLILGACLTTNQVQDRRGQADAPSDGKHDFLQIAFGQDYALNDATRLHRWEGPVRYHIHGKMPLDETAALVSVLDDLASLTNLTISPAETEANFIIHRLNGTARDALVDRQFPRQPRLRRALKKAACFFYVSARDDGIIQRADVILPSDLDKRKLKHCAHEELAQALGLPGDLPEGRDSIFSEGYQGTGFTEFDRQQIKRLYHPDMRAGLTPDQVRDRLR